MSRTHPPTRDDEERRGSHRAVLAGALLRMRIAMRMALESLWRSAVPPPRPEPGRRQFPSLASMQREWLDRHAREDDEVSVPGEAETPTALPFPTEPARPPASGARHVGH